MAGSSSGGALGAARRLLDSLGVREKRPSTLLDRIREYCQALGTPWTYAIHKNPYAVSGFLWGLPVPLVTAVLGQWTSGGPVTLATCCSRLFSHPVFLLLAAHPFLFAILFGAFGTIRERQARHIENLITELEALAQTDGLTGLLNQRHFYKRLPDLAADNARGGKPASLVMIDLDGLKSLNDVHGHAQGDEVLRHIGGLIRRHSRDGDLAARTGGDEFAIFMPDTSTAKAASLAERLRAEIASTPCRRVDDKGRLSVSVSIGVASVLSPTGSVQEMISPADRALYRAKSEGRNRVVTG